MVWLIPVQMWAGLGVAMVGYVIGTVLFLINAGPLPWGPVAVLSLIVFGAMAIGFTIGIRARRIRNALSGSTFS